MQRVCWDVFRCKSVRHLEEVILRLRLLWWFWIWDLLLIHLELRITCIITVADSALIKPQVVLVVEICLHGWLITLLWLSLPVIKAIATWCLPHVSLRIIKVAISVRASIHLLTLCNVWHVDAKVRNAADCFLPWDSFWVLLDKEWTTRALEVIGWSNFEMLFLVKHCSFALSSFLRRSLALLMIVLLMLLLVA